ncbi:MAG: phosphate/phosphite/phosphonate ABC transporter substrate-binding protein [Peptococcaceae bacterium]|nr:phosphate/phosphite/phosphonate ABC transporter substrate-binding protein [Peptococcaceae bacterium]
MRVKRGTLIFMAMFMVFSLTGCGQTTVGPAANNGDLSAAYTDSNGDLTADLPTDSKLWRDPEVLTFSYAPLEEAGAYADIFDDFVSFLSEKTGKQVVQNVMASNSAGLISMRDGQLDIGSFASGTTCYAVNLAGYVPCSVKGWADRAQGYSLAILVRADSPYTQLAEMKGKKVAHANESSNSGHLAPLALLPQEGVVPGTDYEILFSGSHENSVYGVLDGAYDFACVAARSSVFDRMVADGRVNEDDFRIIWLSSTFPTSSFGYAHDLHPDLAAKIKEAFNDYKFTPEMTAAFGGTDRFFPVTYMRDYSVVRLIAESAGEKFDEAGLQKMIASESK